MMEAGSGLSALGMEQASCCVFYPLGTVEAHHFGTKRSLQSVGE